LLDLELLKHQLHVDLKGCRILVRILRKIWW
jgi:hypothetical protein